MKSISCFLIALFGLVHCQTGFQKLALKLHNDYREKHRSPAMKLNTQLNMKAEKCAQHYLEKRKIDHSCTIKGNAGENLAILSHRDAEAAMKRAIKLWYDEVASYSFDKPWQGGRGPTGHFTQLVWAQSKHLGIGLKKGNGFTFIVALYDPPGNAHYRTKDLKREYRMYFKNVLPIRKKGKSRSTHKNSQESKELATNSKETKPCKKSAGVTVRSIYCIFIIFLAKIAAQFVPAA